MLFVLSAMLRTIIYYKVDCSMPACLPDMHFTLFQLSLNAMGLENLQYHLWSLSISILL